jgi:hypothetical protein
MIQEQGVVYHCTKWLQPNISCWFFKSLPLCCLELIHNLQTIFKHEGEIVTQLLKISKSVLHGDTRLQTMDFWCLKHEGTTNLNDSQSDSIKHDVSAIFLHDLDLLREDTKQVYTCWGVQSPVITSLGGICPICFQNICIPFLHSFESRKIRLVLFWKTGRCSKRLLSDNYACTSPAQCCLYHEDHTRIDVCILST